MDCRLQTFRPRLRFSECPVVAEVAGGGGVTSVGLSVPNDLLHYGHWVLSVSWTLGQYLVTALADWDERYRGIRGLC